MNHILNLWVACLWCDTIAVENIMLDWQDECFDALEGYYAATEAIK